MTHPLARRFLSGDPTLQHAARADLAAHLAAHGHSPREAAAYLDPPVRESTLLRWLRDWEVPREGALDSAGRRVGARGRGGTDPPVRVAADDGFAAILARGLAALGAKRGRKKKIARGESSC